MYLGDDELEQLRAELMPDDSTSCTSSLATTVSINFVEDADELHLGAEANSFVETTRRDFTPSKFSEAIEKSGRCSNKGGFLIAMKEVYNSFESLNSHRTNSSLAVISTVNDLISARELDPTDFLAGLGFVNNSEERYRREVLSRFDPSPFLLEKNKFLETKDSRALTVQRVELEESINKTEEWLSQHHENNLINIKAEQNKTSVTGTETTKKPLSKAIRARRKFTKSRQSSFDLLPKLKEEDCYSEGENLNNNERERRKQWAADLKATICEKLEDRIENNTASLLDSNKKTVETSRQLEPEPINRYSSTSSSSKLEREDTLTAITVCNDVDFNTKLSKLSLSTRMESFELEEINSNNGETSDSSRPRVLVSSETLTDDTVLPPPAALDGEFSVKYCDDAESDENESSSGFDEDETANNIAQTLAIGCHRAVAPPSVEEPVQADDLASCFDLPADMESCVHKSSIENSSSALTALSVDNNNKVKNNDYICTDSCSISADILPSSYCVTSDSSQNIAPNSSVNNDASTMDVESVYHGLRKDFDTVQTSPSLELLDDNCEMHDRLRVSSVDNTLCSKSNHSKHISNCSISFSSCIDRDQHLFTTQQDLKTFIEPDLAATGSTFESSTCAVSGLAKETSQS